MIFADTALINGKIYSVDKNGKKTDGDTVLIKDGLILKTGIEKDLQNYISADTEVIDCHGTVSYTHLDVYKRQGRNRSG